MFYSLFYMYIYVCVYIYIYIYIFIYSYIFFLFSIFSANIITVFFSNRNFTRCSTVFLDFISILSFSANIIRFYFEQLFYRVFYLLQSQVLMGKLLICIFLWVDDSHRYVWQRMGIVLFPWHQHKLCFCTRVEDRCRNPYLCHPPDDLFLLFLGLINL